jgi:SRSO17 transposase
LSHVAHQTIASLADRFGQARLPLQGFIGWDTWDEAPLRGEVRAQGARPVGQGDGGLGCEPAGCPQAGREAVGVARQGWGRLGTVDHCQVASSLGYVSSQGHTLVDTRLSLPKAWPTETARRAKAGVPKASRASRTRHPWAVERLAAHGASLRHRWMAGDDERGRPYGVRRRLAALDERSLLAVPSHTALRALATPLPE